MIGFSSHGCFAKLSCILDEEEDRGNERIVRRIMDHIVYYGDSSAIWVCYDPLDCFMMYSHDDSGSLIGNISREEAIQIYPDYLDRIYEINLEGYSLVCADDCGGFLYAKNETSKRALSIF